jgi:hypothetical protein
MKLDAKVKGGLAWAGLVVILAVPAADIFFGKQDGKTVATATAVTADAQAQAGKTQLKLPTAKPAATDPIQTASAGDSAAVDKYIKSGKKLPSYISDGDAVTPAASATPPATAPVKAPTEVATMSTETPPVPLPRSARPPVTKVASLPAAEKPLIVDESKVQQEQATTEPFPMSDGSSGDEVVTGDQLEEWDSGSLADYLERKGLMSDSSASSDSYDPDGFYLDEGPNTVKRPKKNLDFFLF